MPLEKRTKIIFTILVVAFVTIILLYDFSSDKALEKEIETGYGVTDPQFLRSMENLLGPAIRGGNQTKTLLNGVEIFPSMLDAIAKAKKTITLETYIYWSGAVGRLFTDALAKQAREGVRVHLLID